MTLLMYASGNGQLATVNFLVKKGVSLHAKNHQGMMALDFAVRNKHAAVIAYLKSLMK